MDVSRSEAQRAQTNVIARSVDRATSMENESKTSCRCRVGCKYHRHKTPTPRIKTIDTPHPSFGIIRKNIGKKNQLSSQTKHFSLLFN
jgi:hypothetical protein